MKGEINVKLVKHGLALLIMLCLLFGTKAYAAGEISIYVNGNYLETDVAPIIVNDRTFVPLRAIFEALGTEVDWDETTSTVTASKEGLVVKTTIGDSNIYVNGLKTTMDVASVIVDGRTLVPVRFVSEAFGCQVEWDSQRFSVYINYDDNSNDGATGSGER